MYDWNVEKFEQRLFMMRDLLEDFLDDGIL